MKVFWGIVITLLVITVVILLLMNKGYKQLLSAMPPKPLTCGKNGNPPCTIADLQAAGWNTEEVKNAEAASNAIQKAFLCQQFGIGC